MMAFSLYRANYHSVEDLREGGVIDVQTRVYSHAAITDTLLMMGGRRRVKKATRQASRSNFPR